MTTPAPPAALSASALQPNSREQSHRAGRWLHLRQQQQLHWFMANQPSVPPVQQRLLAPTCNRAKAGEVRQQTRRGSPGKGMHLASEALDCQRKQGSMQEVSITLSNSMQVERSFRLQPGTVNSQGQLHPRTCSLHAPALWPLPQDAVPHAAS